MTCMICGGRGWVSDGRFLPKIDQYVENRKPCTACEKERKAMTYEKAKRRVFNRAGTPEDKLYRYSARAVDGGPAWLFYDQREERFLQASESKALDCDRLVNEPLAAN